jgi:hypothetical protein
VDEQTFANIHDFMTNPDRNGPLSRLPTAILGTLHQADRTYRDAGPDDGVTYLVGHRDFPEAAERMRQPLGDLGFVEVEGGPVLPIDPELPMLPEHGSRGRAQDADPAGHVVQVLRGAEWRREGSATIRLLTSGQPALADERIGWAYRNPTSGYPIDRSMTAALELLRPPDEVDLRSFHLQRLEPAGARDFVIATAALFYGLRHRGPVPETQVGGLARSELNARLDDVAQARIHGWDATGEIRAAAQRRYADAERVLDWAREHGLGEPPGYLL